MTRQPDHRTFARRCVLQIEQAAFTAAVDLLATTVRHRLGPPTAVIGIAAGGMPPAHALGALLTAPTYRVHARHNPTDAIYTQATGDVTCDLTPLTDALASQHLHGLVLLVDDIYGTGATINAVRPAIEPHLAAGADVATVTLCRNAGAATSPDMWLWTVDDWVRFPWEPPPPAGTPIENLTVPGQVRPA